MMLMKGGERIGVEVEDTAFTQTSDRDDNGDVQEAYRCHVQVTYV